MHSPSPNNSQDPAGKLPRVPKLSMGSAVLMIGPPASGKGTQSKLLASALGVVHISSGELLREEVARDTVLGKQVDKIMKSGGLVPDSLLVSLIDKRFSQSDCLTGFILDGYPRAIAQAKTLEALFQKYGFHMERVIALDVPEYELLRRMKARGRADDNLKTFAARMQSFKQETLPLLNFYTGKTSVSPIVAIDSIQDVHSEILLQL